VIHDVVILFRVRPSARLQIQYNMLTLFIYEVSMTKAKATEIKAGAQATNQTDSGKTAGKQGDYTKYFYRNIERLWDAITSLQKENDALHKELATAQIVFRRQ
jgi:hypothetical protein